MTRNHYIELEPNIVGYFARLGMQVVIESRGSRGPDIECLSPAIVGDIKAQSEVTRDLKGYWTHWNSNERFGGKTRDYKLRSEFPDDIDALDRSAKGWIAVIYGQLRNYCRVAGLPVGWLVIEGISESGEDMKKAVDYLVANGNVALESWAETEGIGFLELRFL